MSLDPVSLDCLVENSLKEKKPFVLYRLPNTKKIEAQFQDDASLLKDKSFEKGFCMGAFCKEEHPVYLRADRLFLFEQPNQSIDKSTFQFDDSDDKRSQHIALVEKAVKIIESSDLDKVVLARGIDVEFSEFNALATFYNMCNVYDKAFVYWIFHPKIGAWMGATPELLLNYWSNGRFETMSLAGTVSSASLWTSKEREEQQIVTSYIESQLRPLSNNIEVSPVETIKAGKMFHLRSKLSGILNKGRSLEDLLLALHPTPAVGGFPKQEALKFIRDNEDLNRSFYTGYLGPIGVGGSQSFYVNLRCMQVFDNGRLVVYVGGGINKWSDAIKEWEETVLKSRTLLDVLV